MTTEAREGRAAPQRVWTILPLLEWAEAYLREHGFEESRLNAELLLAHALGLPRLGLYLQFDRPLTAGELDLFRKLILRRMTHEPVQYILGETEFMGLTLEVTPAVLIPRPETEELVEEAVIWLKRSGRQEGSILEIGSGSGNIALALGKFLPGARVTSLEISADALALARRNSARHGLRNVEFIPGDVFALEFEGRFFDALISNPPYVGADEFELLAPEVRDFEPRFATTDGEDGFRFIRRIIGLARRVLRPGGGMFMEIGYGQAPLAEAIARESGLTEVGVRKDFAGIGRILSGVRPS
ncbi:MAG TPA: peptide chain release factor N(5)-glutamine methyltransferase [Bacteroidota bacterium]|nr:peptide chain release factor N(5)-glutamine methyltransferase [Bacteroidota bacterium]